jgi:hypothetical protein
MRLFIALALLIAACGSDDTAKPPADGSATAETPADRPIEVPPAPAALGEACTENGGCRSGICADNVCCSSACAGPCRRCDTAAQLGTCALVPAGTACGGSICTDLTTFRPQAVCDQAGSCDMPAPVSCAPSRCLDNACVVTCTRDDECQTPATCQMGACRVGDGGVGDGRVGDASDAD